MSPPELGAVLDEIWVALIAGRDRGKDPFHLPAVATIRDGVPHVRTVVLRGVDRAQGLLSFHTDRRSPKVGDLAASPRISWLFYAPQRKLQLRVHGSTTVHHDDAVADEAWQTVTPLGRRCYGQALGPGSPSEGPAVELPDLQALEEADAGTLELCRRNFCVVRCRIDEIDRMDLSIGGHRRSRFLRQVDTWRGAWLAP
jgi:hypothetical protein